MHLSSKFSLSSSSSSAYPLNQLLLHLTFHFKESRTFKSKSSSNYSSHPHSFPFYTPTIIKQFLSHYHQFSYIYKDINIIIFTYLKYLQVFICDARLKLILSIAIPRHDRSAALIFLTLLCVFYLWVVILFVSSSPPFGGNICVQ